MQDQNLPDQAHDFFGERIPNMFHDPDAPLQSPVAEQPKRFQLQSGGRLTAGAVLLTIGLWSLLYHLNVLPSPFFIIDFITDYAEYTLPVAVMICGLYLLVRAFMKPNAAKPVAVKVEAPVEAQPVKKLYRVTTHKKISGVAAGVAAYFGWDTTFTRIAFLLSIPLTQGLAVVFYIALAVILPKDKEIFGKATVKNSDGAEQTVHVQ